MKRIYRMFIFLCMSVVVLNMNTINAQSHKMYVGTYTSGSESNGVYVYDFDEKSGNATFVKTIPMSNPSFLVRNDDILYAVNEDTKGMLTAYDLKNDIVINQVSTGGMHPCHVSLSPNQPLAVVSNYSSGSLGLLSLNSNGSIKQMEDLIEFKGSSINKDRQKQSHVHSAFFKKDGSQVFVSDLGADLIYVFRIESVDGKYGFKKIREIKTKLGGGPRHLTFSKDEKTIYSVLELTGEIEVFQWTGTDWISKQIVPMFPTDFKGEHGGGDIKIDKKSKYVYATNRGTANFIYQYKINKNSLLSLEGFSSVYGDSPRNLHLSPKEKRVIVSNQNSNKIVILDKKINSSNENYKKVEIPKPVCVVF
jgi:6-phosphogluconolactonase